MTFCRCIAQRARAYADASALLWLQSIQETDTPDSTIIGSGMLTRLPPLIGPDVTRDFVYVDEVLDAYLLAAMNTAGEPGAI
jgi:hypothetical protein